MKEISLITRGGYIALVDDEDFDWASGVRWRAMLAGSGRRYAISSERIAGKQALMHREIAARMLGRDKISNQEIDHIDGDPLNNQRSNLRLCSHRQNMRNRRKSRANTSGYMGVSRSFGKWAADIWVGKAIHLGRFTQIEEAARVRDEAAKKYHGEFAVLNFPEKECAS